MKHNCLDTGKVIAISTSEKKGVSKTNVAAARLIEDWGIEGDAHAGKWHRQVSLLAVESIGKMRDKGAAVCPGDFAENITTEFINVPALHVGDRIVIGKAEIQITQIGKQCHTKCAIFHQVGDCIIPREGVFGMVLTGGTIRKGDSVQVRPAIKLADMVP